MDRGTVKDIRLLIMMLNICICGFLWYAKFTLRLPPKHLGLLLLNVRPVTIKQPSTAPLILQYVLIVGNSKIQPKCAVECSLS